MSLQSCLKRVHEILDSLGLSLEILDEDEALIQMEDNVVEEDDMAWSEPKPLPNRPLKKAL